MDHITAKVSCFAREFHFRNNTEWIFRDEAAEKLLGEQVYAEIAANMQTGIQFFAPEFKGSDEETLRFIADHQLAPSVLGRSAFCEQYLDEQVKMGCRQYVVFASGYDTFVFRKTYSSLKVFELDMPELIEDKQRRIQESKLRRRTEGVMLTCDLSGAEKKEGLAGNGVLTEGGWPEILVKSGFRPGERAFGSLLGISYYLSKQEFTDLLHGISAMWSKGSFLCFDCPAAEEGDESRKNRQLAHAAKEQMKARYGEAETEQLLSECGFQVCQHLNEEKMTQDYFRRYNTAVPEHRMYAPKGVQYILAVKK